MLRVWWVCMRGILDEKKTQSTHTHTHTHPLPIGHDHSGNHEWQSHVGEELGCSVQTPHREGEGSEGLCHETFLRAPQTETLGGSRNTRIQKEDESYQLILSFIVVYTVVITWLVSQRLPIRYKMLHLYQVHDIVCYVVCHLVQLLDLEVVQKSSNLMLYISSSLHVYISSVYSIHISLLVA